MKVTKDYLKQLILEELSEQEGLSAADFKKQQIQQATKMQSGVQDKERAILSQVESKLRKFAEKGNLAAAGRLTRILQMLNAELDKVLKK
tara:strand:+ start:980 stop:1249 length:270 start_codon:yes stop_codon:yes gene_type:complete